MNERLETALMERKGRRVGAEIRFLCPVHEERAPSAYYNTEKRAWNCQGCGANGGKKSLCEALGLSWEPDPSLGHGRTLAVDGGLPPGIPRTMGEARLTLIHTYRSADGEVIGYAVRYDGTEGKSVYPFFSREKDRWKSKAPAAPRPLYGLDLLTKRPDDLVWVVEGEKCADCIRRLGGLAITSQGGSKAVGKTDWTPARGRRVVIWPDLDAAGKSYAVSVRKDLKGHGGVIDEIDPRACGLEEKGADVADWLKANPTATLADLEALPRNGDPCKPTRLAAGDSSWADCLETNEDGNPKATDGNLYQIFLNDPLWKGALGWNQRSLEVVALRDTPIGLHTGEILLDHHASQAASWLYSQWGMPGPGRAAVLTGACSAAREHTFDPVRDWLETLKWDGQKRAERWLWEAGGCPVDDYTIAVAEKFLIGAAARALRYGCKVDTVPVFCGPQGSLKSTMLRALMPNPEWFDDSFSPSEIGDKDTLLQIHGPWLIEIQELDGLGKRESSTVKAFISRASDRFRQPYGRVTERHDRGCVFAGTVNPDAFLVDTTGNRRYWPVAFRRGNIKWIEDNRDQLWAEAVARFRAGDQWWLTDDLERLASAQQEAHRQEDPWEERVRKYIGEHPGKPICQGLLLNALLDGAKSEDPKQGARIARILQILVREGWRREDHRRRIEERNAFWYVPPIAAVDGIEKIENEKQEDQEESQERLGRNW
jgi:predicted P-loop ATPase